MRRRAIALIASQLATAACGIRVLSRANLATPAADPDDAVPRIEPEVAYREAQAGRAAIYDVRGPLSYADKHAVGAALIPLDDFEASIRGVLSRLPANMRPILYCT